MSARDELAQYFTPRVVIDFALDVLEVMGGTLAGAQVVDPACGPGEWLEAALQRGAARVVGVDRDPAMVHHWQERGLLADTHWELKVADGLRPEVLLEAGFDVVLGNPPFGAGLADDSEAALRRLAQVCRVPWQGDDGGTLSARALERLRRCPTELLFMERFVRLSRPEGWVVIVLPEGALSNARGRNMRKWLLSEVTIAAVIGLPRSAFSAQRTTAKTALLVMRRDKAPAGHEVALAQVDACERTVFERVLAHLRRRRNISTRPPEGLIPPPLLRGSPRPAGGD